MSRRGRGSWSAVLALAVGCTPGGPPGDPAVARPRADTTTVAVGAVRYMLKLDGTVHFPASPVHLTLTAHPAGPAPPPVTRLEVVVTAEGAADPAARSAVPARWVAGAGGWELDVRNAFPDPDPAAGERLGRRFPAGPYRLAVDLYDGDRLVGRAGPMDVYLGFVRTRD